MLLNVLQSPPSSVSTTSGAPCGSQLGFLFGVVIILNVGLWVAARRAQPFLRVPPKRRTWYNPGYESPISLRRLDSRNYAPEGLPALRVLRWCVLASVLIVIGTPYLLSRLAC